MKLIALIFFIMFLAGCGRGPGGLKPGVSTLPQVLEQMGEPTMAWSERDGSLLLEFSRLPEANENYLVSIGSNGVLISLRQTISEESISRVRGGMNREQVRQTLGKPGRIDYTQADSEEAWFWPLGKEQPEKWQIMVHFGAEGTVQGIQRVHSVPHTVARKEAPAGQDGSRKL